MKKLICLILLFLSTCLFVTPVSYAEDDGVKTEFPAIKEEKSVTLRIQVFKDRSLGEISVQESSGDKSVDNAAIKAVRKWNFLPAKDSNGESIDAFFKIKVTFRPTD